MYEILHMDLKKPEDIIDEAIELALMDPSPMKVRLWIGPYAVYEYTLRTWSFIDTITAFVDTLVHASDDRPEDYQIIAEIKSPRSLNRLGVLTIFVTPSGLRTEF